MQHGFDYKVSLKHANMRARAHFHTLCVCVAFQILVPTVLHSQVKTEEIKEKKQAKIRSLRLKDYGTKEEEESLVEPSAVSCVVLILTESCARILMRILDRLFRRIFETIETFQTLETFQAVKTCETVEIFETSEIFETFEALKTFETFETFETIEILETLRRLNFSRLWRP